MINIAILGTGNVAEHLVEAFYGHDDIVVSIVYGRTRDSLRSFGQKVATTSDIDTLKNVDVFIIAVSDDAIESVAQKIKDKKGLVVHTAGNMAIDILPSGNRGVFYPLQTFTKGKKINFKKVPICIESENDHNLDLLRKLATSISDQVVAIDSEQRKALHLAAVFANNFSNHLYLLAKEICDKQKISFDLLNPLILETAEKAGILGPLQAQTGPAKRMDQTTMEEHLALLTNIEHKKIYSLLSNSIQHTYGKKL